MRDMMQQENSRKTQERKTEDLQFDKDGNPIL